MTYLNYLNEKLGSFEEDPVYINTSRRKSKGTIGSIDDEDPKFDNHMQFLKNTLQTSEIKNFLQQYLRMKNAEIKELESALSNMFKKFWTGEFTFDEFEKSLRKSFNLTRTRTLKLSNMTSHVDQYFDPRFFDELFKLTIGKKGTSVGEGEIILWFIFGNLLNPVGKGDIISKKGEEFEIKKAFGATGFRFISQKKPILWSQLLQEFLQMADKYKLNIPIIAGATTKSFTKGKASEMREALINNPNDQLYREFINSIHPYRQFSQEEMSTKLSIFKEAVKTYETFEDFIVACQFYSYVNLEGFGAIGFWKSPELLTVVGGNDLHNFSNIYNIVRKHLKAYALWDSGRGPGQVRAK